MAEKQRRIRWTCPTGRHPGELGPRRPRRDALIRYCVPCSLDAGVLVERTAPTLERERAAAAERTKTKAQRQRATAARARQRAAEQQTARCTVEGVDLRVEMKRLIRLSVFGGPQGRMARRPPTLEVRPRKMTPRSRLGAAWPWRNRIILNTWPGSDLADARETLVHELVHIYLGTEEGERGHGVRFWQVMDTAFRAAYGRDLNFRFRTNSYHGRYAAALRKRDRAAAADATGDSPSPG